MLQTFLMNSKSVVRASVELNLRKVEKVEEEYAPDKAVVASQKKMTEKSVNGKAKPGGVPGVGGRRRGGRRQGEAGTGRDRQSRT